MTPVVGGKVGAHSDRPHRQESSLLGDEALRDTDQRERRDHRDDEAEHVELPDVAGAEQGGDHATDEGAGDAEPSTEAPAAKSMTSSATVGSSHPSIGLVVSSIGD